jgi:dTDP-4-amino-4,6-dideoxygalactose transaminase
MSAPPLQGAIPLVDLGSQYRSIRSEIDAAIQAVLERGDFILGEDVGRFEQEFARFCGVRDCVGTSSGTSALRLALAAIGVGAGDEVITSAHTFIATLLSILETGAKPVLVDCDPATYQIDPDLIERAITPRTKAIVPVHLYGHPADMDAVLAVARARGLAVVEDACQAHGAIYRGKRCGALADAAAFSFYPGKNLGAYGDGGAVVSDREDVMDRVRLLRDYGQRTKNRHEVRGSNERLDTLQAAVLRVKLPHLEKWNEARRAVARRYDAELSGTDLVLPRTRPDVAHVFHLYVVRSERRDALRAALTAEGIACGVHYPTPPHLQPALSELGYGPGSFPVAEFLAGQVLSLPMYPELSAELVSRIADVCRSS